MNSFRVEKHPVTQPGVTQSRLIQGAFRYEKLNLSTAGELRLRNVGVKQTIHATPLHMLPGSFECSDEDLTQIWHTGARTAELTEIPKNTIPNFWQVSSEGSLVESSLPQPLAVGLAPQLTGYELDFEVKPLTGEFLFSVLSDTIGNGLLIYCDIESLAVRTSTGHTGHVPSAAGAHPEKWLKVHAIVDMSEVVVSINNQTALAMNQTAYTYGAFGLGTALGHSAYYRNLRAVTLQGDPIYSNSLTESSVLDDFLMGDNPLDTIVDGSRRDRIAYAGDLDISIGVSYASTYAKSFVEGSIKLLGSFQTTSGFFIPNAKIQQSPLEQLLPINITGLIGYSFNLLNGMFTHYEVIGDVEFAIQWAPSVQSMLDWADSQVVDGLFRVNEPSFAGDWNYYDPPQTGASSKFNALYAYSLQQSQPLLRAAGVDAAIYQKRLVDLRAAMNNRLWDAKLGAYVLSDETKNGFAQDAQAIALLAGVPQSHNISTFSILQTMNQSLQVQAGPLAFSPGAEEAGFARKISPFASSYHLRAALESKATDTALLLLRSLWAPMANPSGANYTHTFWETLDPDGSPGLGLQTSLCHGWAAGPTAELSKHVLGAKATKPGFDEWEVQPLTLDLDWARGRTPTRYGPIKIEWRFAGPNHDLFQMEVTSPPQGATTGLVRLPESLRVALNESVVTVDGRPANGSSYPVDPGEVLVLRQEKLTSKNRLRAHGKQKD